MYTTTWIPGTNAELDNLFEQLRQVQHQDRTHKLWNNYSESAFKNCSAFSINFVDNEPFFCSSIIKKSCWPDDTYRILNRLWKPAVRTSSIKRLSPGLGSMLHSQLEWLSSNTEYKLAFVSRDSDHWQKFFLDNFSTYFNLEFKMNNHKYLTCEHENESVCWQKIIYYGDESVLEYWKSK